MIILRTDSATRKTTRHVADAAKMLDNAARANGLTPRQAQEALEAGRELASGFAIYRAENPAFPLDGKRPDARIEAVRESETKT